MFWRAFPQAESDVTITQLSVSLLLQAGAEVHAGLVPLLTDSPARKDEAIALANCRLQALWLQGFYEPLAQWATSAQPASPQAQALLLLLGLQQYQTTWTWPSGPTWASWFASGHPPEHWLASFAWHQCQAVGTDDPAEAARWLDLARADLARGDWPELSAALEQHLLQPTPPEIRALYTDKPIPGMNGEDR